MRRTNGLDSDKAIEQNGHTVFKPFVPRIEKNIYRD